MGFPRKEQFASKVAEGSGDWLCRVDDGETQTKIEHFQLDYFQFDETQQLPDQCRQIS
jgi:hypothetical protein